MSEVITIERRKLFEQVAAHIEREIIEGKLKPGDRLPPERDLQTRFGVGRPAIREALIALQRAGLIEQNNGMPARVTKARAEGVVANMVPAVRQMLGSAEGQRQLQQVRLFMEIGLVRQAAENATENDLEKLKAALEENRKAVGDSEQFIQTDVEFHFQFASMIHNPVFIALHGAMSTWLREQREFALMEPGEAKRSYQAHKRIYEAVAAHNPDAAEKAMREHLASGWNAFWKRYKEPE